MNDMWLPQPGSAGNAVYGQLKERIVTLELPPGTALSEKEMAAAFNVSRTPVRESFVRLAQEELVVVLPQRGTRVSLIDPELVLEARFMREQLERAVIRLACEQFPEEGLTALADNLARQQDSIRRHDNHAMFALDEEFHRILFRGCRKLGTWNVIQQMNAHLNRTRVLWLTTDPHWEHLYDQHKAMYEAILAQNAGSADQLMKEHLNLSIANLPVLQERYPDYFKK
ncbi:MAG: GntR family transcriptional regulator [Paenibacillus macerans]|uniref:Bacterial regulatory s, gntR family protein n=1 Tax=Paenibacillus macerans TaxID=44252 RepID=A0A090Y7P7_PAEMA|nr:GntR family transcriptional regulator [Paenibacillus macerans]KFM94206.1 bacterial regulatory s, gntR family protein [Paenibacillus macerans]MCY7561874.1 GntR family transcriptional regulator [Paenibacillus macerans]MDU7472400.1 GntR family transcriptional regulator [Paenibacillus macerans]MEC0138392.1 GntR family transcriptional regulator [Paenibacillus macerans]MEC0149601.1 GntR family transcriptional regulator [Paenibacillus macerans]